MLSEPAEKEPLPLRIVRTPRFSIRWTAELIWRLAAHQVTVRYKESLLGLGWILVQPAALTLVFTYIRRIANIPTGEVPYPIFVATGLVAWTFTSSALSKSLVSVAGRSAIIKRVAVPRIAFPLSTLTACLVDLCVLLLLLGAMFFFYPPNLSETAVWLPIIFAAHLALLIGLGCILSLSEVWFRDIGHAAPHLIQLWFFASPVFYPAALVPRELRWIARCNPMTGIIEGYRSVLLEGAAPSAYFFVPALILSFAIGAAGVLIFQKTERVLPDLI